MDAIEHIRSEGASLLDAIESALNHLLGSGDAVLPERWARFQVSATTVEEAVGQGIEAMAGLADDFRQAPARVELDGLRPIESGWRMWGRLGLSDESRVDFPGADAVVVITSGEAGRHSVEITLSRGSL